MQTSKLWSSVTKLAPSQEAIRGDLATLRSSLNKDSFICFMLYLHLLLFIQKFQNLLMYLKGANTAPFPEN